MFIIGGPLHNRVSTMDSTTEKLIRRREKLLGPAYRLFYDEPVHLVRGEGAWLWDRDGRRYLDMYNNVAHVGHCHPRVVEAICRQAGRLNTHTRYLHETVVDYAGRLTATMPPGLDAAMFCCTGSEANELALRIARAVTGGTGIIVTDFAYHGNTQATWEISPEDCGADLRPAHVVTIPTPDTYRGPYAGSDAGARYAGHVEQALEVLAGRGVRPAALVVDTVVSSGGVVVPPAGFLSRAAELVRSAGGMFIADEVQPGFGRTGSHFWGFEADGCRPDIVTMGKPMGNGHPVAGVVTRAEFAAALCGQGGYFNTFGGNPVSAAAAVAVLDVIEDEALQANALDVGGDLARGLRKLAERHESIGEVRANGLFIAVELVADRQSKEPAPALAAAVVNGLRSRGVLTGAIGPHGNILKLRPPLVLDHDDAGFLIEALDDTLGSTRDL
jgi:4-aminobutyrate aminotransferase-like enzyme